MKTTGASSNGRTPAFEAEDRGSSPCAPTKSKRYLRTHTTPPQRNAPRRILPEPRQCSTQYPPTQPLLFEEPLSAHRRGVSGKRGSCFYVTGTARLMITPRGTEEVLMEREEHCSPDDYAFAPTRH